MDLEAENDFVPLGGDSESSSSEGMNDFSQSEDPEEEEEEENDSDGSDEDGGPSSSSGSPSTAEDSEPSEAEDSLEESESPAAAEATASDDGQVFTEYCSAQELGSERFRISMHKDQVSLLPFPSLPLSSRASIDWFRHFFSSEECRMFDSPLRPSLCPSLSASSPSHRRS